MSKAENKDVLSNTNGSDCELSDVFEEFLPAYLESHSLSLEQSRAVTAIMNCGTLALGAHKFVCDGWDYEEIAYNSCKNRHCPKCQYRMKVEWVKARLESLLPIPYYHVVFTLPHLANELCLHNQSMFYDLFFSACAETLQAFASDEKRLGGQLGLIGVLHTWGSSLPYHVHNHFIVTGGGLTADGSEWKNLPYSHKFMFPVKAMSQVVKGKFLSKLDKKYQSGELNLASSYSTDATYYKFIKKLSSQEWVCYSKAPFASPEAVVDYLGRYTHRVAISNYRIKAISNGRVYFSYKKYQDGTVCYDEMSLSGVEFIRRFLLHVLDRGFKRIRYYGLFGSGHIAKNIALIRELLAPLPKEFEERLSELLSKLSAFLDRKYPCPVCGTGNLVFKKRLSYYELCFT